MARIGPLGEPDRYELLELRSSGGEGQLWRGSLDVDGVQIVVAVKSRSTYVTRNDNLTEWRTRWQRQAELLRSLDHPGLVKVRDIFFEGPLPHAAGAADPTTNTLYLVMNWVEGPSLDEWVARNPNHDILDSAKVLGRLAAAVDYLHSGAVTGSPVLHRDIKPANVIVTDRGAVLVNFGFTTCSRTNRCPWSALLRISPEKCSSPMPTAPLPTATHSVPRRTTPSPVRLRRAFPTVLRWFAH